jgi:hypothetical protein
MGVYRKVYPISDAEARRRHLDEFCYCQVCGRSQSQAKYDIMGLVVHHIIRWRRSDEKCNFMSIDEPCHSLTHDGVQRDASGVLLPRLTLGMILWAKMVHDPANWLPDRLEALNGQRLPELKELPTHIMEQWRKNRGSRA